MFEVNSFQIPNDLVDEYLDKLNGNDLKILLVIIRKTKGWNKEFDGISISQFQKITGIKDERTIRKSIKKLIELELVERKENSGKFSVYRLTPPAKNDGGQKISSPAKNAPPPPAKNAPHNNTLPKDNNIKEEKESSKQKLTLLDLVSLIRDFFLEEKLNFSYAKRVIYENKLSEYSKKYSLEDIKKVIEFAKEDNFYKKILPNPKSFFNGFESIKVAMQAEEKKREKETPTYSLDFNSLSLPEGWVL